MADLRAYEVLAEAFAAEGVDVHFSLLGDANMYWATALTTRHGVRSVHARHEHSAVMMAIGYARAWGKVGVASVTCGPGFTQIATALTVAARGNVPLVVFVGETPLQAAYATQHFDQPPLAAATGARYIQVHHIDRLLDGVREAFHCARLESRPVVLGVPADLQKQKFPHMVDYMTSLEYMPTPQRLSPNADLIKRAADMLAAAERPIVLAGRGAVRSGAGAALRALAERSGALLATSLFGKGLFDEDPFSIGISGTFAGPVSREQFAESDLVIGVGASLSHFTAEAGYMYPGAQVIQMDTHPRGLWQGLRVADLYIQADALLAAQALDGELASRSHSSSGARTPELRQAIAEEARLPDPKPFDVQPGLLDPRAALLEIDRVVPKDWNIVVGTGHVFTFVVTHLRDRAPERWTVMSDFGVIGSALPAAIGVAAGRADGKTLLLDGDGSFLMHASELETIRRQGIGMVIGILNDGAYGTEVHRFRAEGLPEDEVVHGRGDLAAVARGFGLGGVKVTKTGEFDRLLREHESSGSATLWDLHIDDKIPSAQYRRIHYAEI